MIRGHRVIEVRARGVSKEVYARQAVVGTVGPSHRVLAAGDDHTDLDLYEGAPAGSACIHVGAPLGGRRLAGRRLYGVPSPAAFRALLGQIADAVEDRV